MKGMVKEYHEGYKIEEMYVSPSELRLLVQSEFALPTVSIHYVYCSWHGSVFFSHNACISITIDHRGNGSCSP